MANVSPRKMPKGKRVLPTLPPESPRLKLVTFNDEVTETSIGGTRRVGKIKKEIFLNFEQRKKDDSNVSSRSSSRNGSMSTPSEKSKSNSKPPQVSRQVSSGKENKHTTIETIVTEEIKPQVPSSSGSESDAIDNKSSSQYNPLPEDIPPTPVSVFRTPNPLNDHQPRRHTLESKLFGTPDCYRNVNLETPRRMLPMVQDESVDEGEDSCSIMVAVRVRPFAQRELVESSNYCAVSMEGNQTVVRTDHGPVHRFAYDFSFWSQDEQGGEFSGQETVYKKLAQPMLGKAFEGYNTCLFAYGQTGSGKSYSIMGHGRELGIIPRFCAELFQRAESLKDRKKVKVNVEISFYEIYNEKIHDLLATTANSKERGTKKASLKVREHPQLGPYVEGLSNYVVNSFDDVEGWINLGNKNRATATTAMNDKSSRSHSILTVILTQTKTESIEGQEHDHNITSKINLVDLAGSERQSFANTTGERLREGANINKSLLTLGKVISLLSEKSVSSKKRKMFIPYRDSVLTWLLKESLGGNSKTAMLATISPSSLHLEETLSTLRYAHQARSIVNLVRVNEDPKARIIRQLRMEIDKLRAEQGGGTLNEETLAASVAEVSRLKSEMEELSRSWQERLRQAEAKKAEELQLLERAGIAFKVDNRLPNLVNLNEDPQLSEMLLYVIKEGKTRVGRKLRSSHYDIQLTGALIADYHCVIQNEGGQVNITPIKDAPTYVNGNLISACTVLHHGDRVILGGDHFFRFNHPIEVKKNKTDGKGGNSEIKDFDYAKQELHSVQEERLQAEVQKELEKTRQEFTQQKDGYETKLKGLEEVLTSVEQTHKEAQSTIHSLKKKNMMLEQEVLAGRKRQQKEPTIFQQALDELPNRKSRIMELLESERRQMKEYLESHRVKRSQLEMTTSLKSTNPQSSPVNGDIAGSTNTMSTPSRGRGDLYRMALLLREANKINQYLNSNLVFCREDTGNNAGEGVGHTQIRVINTRHKMSTAWSVARFEEKLEQMRDIYNNDGDVSADDDDVFNDPEDVWEKDTSTLTASPASLSNSLNGVWRSPAWIKRTAPSPLLNGTRRGTLNLGGDSIMSPREKTHQGLLNMFRSIFSISEDVFSELSLKESIADKILVVCQRITDNTATVMRHSRNYSNSAGSLGENTSWLVPIFQLATDVQTLTSLTSSLCSSLSLSSPQSSSSSAEGGFLMDLMGRLKEAVKTIHHKGNCLLQGCEGRITSLVCESGQKLEDTLFSLVETIGEMSMGLGLQLVRLDNTDDHLHPSIKLAFLQGSCRFVLHSQDGARLSLQSLESKCDRLQESSIKQNDTSSGEMCKRIGHILNCTRCFLEKTSSVQKQVERYHQHFHHRHQANRRRPSDSSEEDGSDNDEDDDNDDELPAHQYSAIYKQLQGIVAQASTITDSCALLVQAAQAVVLGTGNDGKRLEKCARLVLSGCQRLLAISSSQPSSSSGLLSSSSILSSTSKTTSSLLTTSTASPQQLHNKNIDSRIYNDSSQNQSDKSSMTSISTLDGNDSAPSPSSTATETQQSSDFPSTFTSVSSLNLASTTTAASPLTNEDGQGRVSNSNRNISENENVITNDNNNCDTSEFPGDANAYDIGGDTVVTDSKRRKSSLELSDIIFALQTRLQSLQDANQEVAMATVMFEEFLLKSFGSCDSNDGSGKSGSSDMIMNRKSQSDRFAEVRGISTTPRGQRMLPASPKHRVVTMAGKEAIFKKRERKAGLALAELGSKKASTIAEEGKPSVDESTVE